MLPTTTGRRLTRTPRSLPGLRNELDRLFEDFLERPTAETGRLTPPADMWETDDAYVVELELPGFDRDGIDVAVEQGALTVAGRREIDAAEDHDVHLRERTAGTFRRSFSLPASIRADDVSARFEDGVLRIDLPKAERAKTRKIEVDVS